MSKEATSSNSVFHFLVFKILPPVPNVMTLESKFGTQATFVTFALALAIP